MIVIDLVYKRTYFVLTYIIVTTKNTVRLFLHNVWKLYSLSTYIILDRSLLSILTRNYYGILGL